MKAKRPTLVRDPHRSIHVLLHQHVGAQDRLMNLIESPLVRNSEVLAQAASRLQAQIAVQFPGYRTGSMQIRGLRGLNGEAPIVDRHIALQELIRRVERGDVREPHLLNHPILKGVKQPLHPPLGLGRVGWDQLHPQLVTGTGRTTFLKILIADDYPASRRGI